VLNFLKDNIDKDIKINKDFDKDIFELV